MEWYQIFGIPAILSTVIPFLVTRYFHKKDKKEEVLCKNTERIEDLEHGYKSLEEEREKLSEEYEGKIADIKTDVSDVSIVLEVLKDSMKDVLRDRIVHLYNNYYEEKKYMPIYAKESLNCMYKSYIKLNGNGVAKGLVKSMLELPTSPQNVDDDSEDNSDIF